MIKIFGGKSFKDALKHTKKSLDDINTQSSLSTAYLSNNDIDVCNTVLYNDNPYIAVIDPTDVDDNKKIVITKCVNVSNDTDYKIIIDYIEKLTKQDDLPHTIIIPYTADNSTNALIYEINQEANENEYSYKTKFLFAEKKFEKIDNYFKEFTENNNLDLNNDVISSGKNDSVFEFLSLMQNVATAALNKEDGQYLKAKEIMNTPAQDIKEQLNELICSKINDDQSDDDDNDERSVVSSYYTANGSGTSQVDSIISNDNLFKKNDFLKTIASNFNSDNLYAVQETKDSILITDKTNHQQIIKAQTNKGGVSVQHDGNNNTWLALFEAMHNTENFKCEFSFTGNDEESKKLAEQFLRSVNNQLEENPGILNNIIFDMDEKTKDIINQVLNDSGVEESLGVDRVLTYFGINDFHPEIESKNTELFQSYQKSTLKFN